MGCGRGGRRCGCWHAGQGWLGRAAAVGTGLVAYARGGPNTRSIQLYVSLADNARLDTLNTFGFPPIGEVISGMEAVDSLYSGYSGTRTNRLQGPSQDSIRIVGNAYLQRNFPLLDRIVKASIIKSY